MLLIFLSFKRSISWNGFAYFVEKTNLTIEKLKKIYANIEKNIKFINYLNP